MSWEKAGRLDRMKVCLNLLAATTGGQLTRARAFLDRFHRFAPTAELVVIKEKAVLPEYVSEAERLIVDVPIGLGKLKALRRMCWENSVMPRVLRKHAPDVYLTFSHYLPQVHDASLPSVVGVSTLAPFSAHAWASESWLVRLKMVALRRSILSSARRADLVLALSETCREVLIRCGIPGNKISVTPNGVDSYWGSEVRSTGFLANMGIDRPFILYVSHFYRYKNHLRLVEAYSRLPLLTRMAHQLVLVGNPYSPSYYKKIQNLVASLGLLDEVIVLPGEGKERLRDLYQSAKLFVFPSLIENSPNILLEAMMAGLPVATSNLPPMPEFGDAAAEYFDALDVSSISRVIEHLLGNPSRLRDMRRRSSEQAARFSWDSFMVDVVKYCGAIAKTCKRSQVFQSSNI